MNRCKVCARIGKDSNHYTKVHGVVVCPVIKNAVCRRCGKTGHFHDHCREPQQYILRQKQAVNPAVNQFYMVNDRYNDGDLEALEQVENPQPPQLKIAPWVNANTPIPKESAWAAAADSDEE
jgi:hypothetical protein